MVASALLNRIKRRLVKQMNHTEEARKASCEANGEGFDYDPEQALVSAINELGYQGLLTL